MNAIYTESQFDRMGARWRVSLRENARPGEDYTLDIRADSHGQYFELRLPTALAPSLEIAVLQAQPRERHLVLLVKKPESKDRFLCGHDEREWFVAAVPGKATTVAQAREALKPQLVRWAEDRQGLRPRDRERRRNAVSIRQGEWFFLPRPALQVKAGLIRHREPIRRGAGKPHWVEEVFRDGGEPVYVTDKYPNGLTEHSYRKVLERRPEARKWRWISMRRGAAVYARGAVRHPDHATIILPCWHEVLINTENQSRTMANVAFLD